MKEKSMVLFENRCDRCDQLAVIYLTLSASGQRFPEEKLCQRHRLLEEQLLADDLGGGMVTAEWRELPPVRPTEMRLGPDAV